MGDLLTILRCAPNLSMAKVWRADGTILPYSSAKWFTASREPVADLPALSALLARLEGDPQACIIRGAPKAGTDPERPLRRLLENLDDAPLHSVLIEIDNYQPLVNDPLAEPVEAALEYIAECLPPAFQGVSFHWQLSNSAGAPGKESLFKAHLWMWLQTPYDSATLRAWAKAEQIQVDIAVLQPAQVHYTAAPVLEPGAQCPVTQRSGLWRGSRDSVPLAIDVAALEVRSLSARQRGERLDVDDPLADFLWKRTETWGELANGGLKISCPFEAQHSSGAPGDSSSVYFPAGTNGYPSGSFVCLHSGCRDRDQESFKVACGWADHRLACLAVGDCDDGCAGPPVTALQVNGRAALDPLILPPFRRDAKGSIEAVVQNVVTAISTPRLCGFKIAWDRFRYELMIREEDPEGSIPTAAADGWRPFTDADAVRLRIVLHEKVNFKEAVGRELMRDALNVLTDEQSFDSAIDWLMRLVPAWDGVERIARFWPDYLETDDTAYTRALGLYSWTAQAGRVLSPGCQVDMVPVMISPEGYAKTSVVGAIAPAREFFAEYNLGHDDEKLARLMRGCLVGELAELRGISVRDGDAILSWITRREEKWTPKYKEYATSLARRMVLYGTTNDGLFMQPHMGKRRWLPVQIRRPIEREKIVADRLQLWAEARERYLVDGVLYAEVERLARDEHATFQAEDPWGDVVVRWLDRPDMAGETPGKKGWVTTLEVAEGALAIPTRTLKRPEQLRIAKLLRDVGYSDAVRRVDGKPKKVWVKAG